MKAVYLAESCIQRGIQTPLNLHESVHVLCEKASFTSRLIVHRLIIIVPRFVDCYDDVPDDHCFLKLDRDPCTRETMFATRMMTTNTAVGRLSTRSTQYKY